MPLLAARTTAEALIARFNVIFQRHGQRPAVPRFADELVRQLERHYALMPRQTIAQLKLPKFMVDMLWQTYYPEPDDRSRNDPPTRPNPAP